MGTYTIKLPDVGEGVAEAELVEWMVKDGQNVREDEVLAAVMTDKATVEIPSPVDGTISWLGASLGDIVAVGSPLIRLEVDGEGNDNGVDDNVQDKTNDSVGALQTEEASEPATNNEHSNEKNSVKLTTSSDKVSVEARSPYSSGQARAVRQEGEKPLAPPAVRARARETGIDLRTVRGSGPAGRITHEDIDHILQNSTTRDWEDQGSMLPNSSRMPKEGMLEKPIIGLRRKIAEKMSVAKSRIPHITYVEEIDVTALEELRGRLNKNKRDDQPKLTMLPFLMMALTKTLEDYPQMNARYDDEAGKLHQFEGVHMGIATQTPGGLIVPVVRHAETYSLWGCANAVAKVSAAARDGSATKDQLSGSTITITSLGAMGGIMTTPVINHPEVAILGTNKMQIKPVWDGTQFIPRKIMNLSSSFDHRVIDGWDCAMFIQQIKAYIESPAEIFIQE